MPVYQQTRWNLDDVLGGETVDYHVGILKELSAQLAQYDIFDPKRPNAKPQDSDFQQSFREALETQEQMGRKILLLEDYSIANKRAGLDPDADVVAEKCNQAISEARVAMAPFQAWWTGLKNSTAKQLYRHSGDQYRYLEKLTNKKPYMLEPEAEEAMKTVSDNMIQRWRNLYGTVHQNLKYPVKIDGVERQLTFADAVDLWFSDRPEDREASYTAVMDVLRDNSHVLGNLFIGNAQHWMDENIKLRGFPSEISPRNLENEVSDEAVEALLSVCRKNTELFHRYFRILARQKGDDVLGREHIYMPLGKSVELDYPDAVDLLFSVVGNFSPEAEAALRPVFDKNHVDSELRDNKYGGAFCICPVIGEVPFMCLNYHGKVKDLGTLAHESGHTIHGHLAQNPTIFVQEMPLTIAESASTFFEMMTLEDYMSGAPKEVRTHILGNIVQGFYSGVISQANLTLFEQEAYRAIREGANIEDLDNLWVERQRKLFGDSVKVPDHFRHGYKYIPHMINTPFYCYAYSFGNILSLSLLQLAKGEGESFVPKYIAFLKSGASKKPEELLADIGITPDEEFWQRGFDLMEEYVGALERSL